MLNGELLARAFAAGRAFPVMFFKTQDSPPSRYIIMDGNKHFDALPCECGHQPRTEYTRDKHPYQDVDGTEYATLGCPHCKRGFTLFTGAPLFDKARGAMGSVLRSWWNASIDKDGHPNDHGSSGGLVATWEDFDAYMKQPQGAATEPAVPASEEEELK